MKKLLFSFGLALALVACGDDDRPKMDTPNCQDPAQANHPRCQYDNGGGNHQNPEPL